MTTVTAKCIAGMGSGHNGIIVGGGRHPFCSIAMVLNGLKEKVKATVGRSVVERKTM